MTFHCLHKAFFNQNIDCFHFTQFQTVCKYLRIVVMTELKFFKYENRRYIVGITDNFSLID